MGGLLHLVQRGDWAGCGPAQSPPRCTVTAHLSTASVYQLRIVRFRTIITFKLWLSYLLWV